MFAWVSGLSRMSPKLGGGTSDWSNSQKGRRAVNERHNQVLCRRIVVDQEVIMEKVIGKGTRVCQMMFSWAAFRVAAATRREFPLAESMDSQAMLRNDGRR